MTLYPPTPYLIVMIKIEEYTLAYINLDNNVVFLEGRSCVYNIK